MLALKSCSACRRLAAVAGSSVTRRLCSGRAVFHTSAPSLLMRISRHASATQRPFSAGLAVRNGTGNGRSRVLVHQAPSATNVRSSFSSDASHVQDTDEYLRDHQSDAPPDVCGAKHGGQLSAQLRRDPTRARFARPIDPAKPCETRAARQRLNSVLQALSSAGSPTDLIDVHRALKACITTRDPCAALELVVRLPQGITPNARTAKWLVRALLSCSCVDDAISLVLNAPISPQFADGVLDLPGAEAKLASIAAVADHSSAVSIIDHLVASQDISTAVDFFIEVCDSNADNLLSVGVVLGIVRPLLERDDLSLAFDVMARAIEAGVRPTEDVVAMTLLRLAKREHRQARSRQVDPKEVQTTTDLISDMLAMMRQVNLGNSAVIFNQVIGYFVKAKANDAAQQWYDRMLSNHAQPDTRTDNLRLLFTSRKRKVGTLQKDFASMVAEGAADTASFNILIDSLAEQGQAQRAMDTFNLLLARGLEPDAYTACSLLKAFRSAKQTDEAIMFFETRMDKLGIVPNVEIYSVMLDIHALTGNIADSLKRFQEVLELGLRPKSETLAALCKVFAVAGRPAEGEKALLAFYEQVQQCNAVPFNVIIKAYLDHSRVDDAKRLATSMPAMGVAPSEHTVALIMHHFARTSDQAGADTFLKEVNESPALSQHISMAMFNGMIDLVARQQNPKAVIALLDQAESAGLRPDAYSYSSAFKAFNKDPEGQVMVLYRRMKAARIKLDIKCYGSLVQALCRTGQLDQAKSVFMEMISKKIRPNAFCVNPILAALNRKGEFNETLKFFLWASDRSDDSSRGRAARDEVTYKLVFKALDQHRRRIRRTPLVATEEEVVRRMLLEPFAGSQLSPELATRVEKSQEDSIKNTDLQDEKTSTKVNSPS